MTTPDYGHRTLTGVIDETARISPDTRYAIIPSSDSFSTKPRDVTFARLANAINRAAWWLEKEIGKPETRSTIAYIGPNDLRYLIFAFAANKVGYAMLLPSTRNSVAFHLHIFKTAKCTRVLRDASYSFDHVKTENPEIKDKVVPDLDYFLSQEPVDHYEYKETPEAFHEPFIIIHSSGSTGMPKCITWTHASLASVDRHHLLQTTGHSIGMMEQFPPGIAFVGFPLFHAGGLLLTLGWGVFYNHTIIFPPPGQMKALTVIDAMKNLHFETLCLPPAIFEELASMPEGLKELEQVRECIYGGGPLSDDRAKVISEHCDVFSIMGTSESATFPVLSREAKDIGYFHYPTELKGLDFRETNDGLYELWFVRDPETDEYHSTWETFPDLQEYSTKDLYSKHPSKPDLFKYEGRNDDVLVLSNGEKVVTLTLESILKGAKGVVEAVIIGQGKFEISALLELTEDAQKMSREEILTSLKPTIAEGNKVMPKFAKLSPERIIFTNPDKPLARAPKGTVIRAQSLKLYKDEIDALYAASEAVDAEKFPLVSTTDIATTTASLAAIFSEIMGIENVEGDTDVFVSGFDSLGVMAAVRKIKAVVQTEKPEAAQLIIPSLVYANPTINGLAHALQDLHPGSGSGEDDQKRAPKVLERFTQDIPKEQLSKPEVPDKINVILTGSTGSLGAYLIDSMINSDKVGHVFALNRSLDGQAKQIKSNTSRKLSTDFSKVTFFHATMNEHNLGLKQEEYDQLKSAHCIIHNQWQVDFNLSLASFEPHIAGLRNLVDLALESDLHPYLIFTSSVSTVGQYFKTNPEAKNIPEKVFENFAVAMPMGYGLGKQVGELMLDVASSRTGLRTSTARIGQVSGPVKRLGGVWNKQEWLPSLCMSSAALKTLPGQMSGIDWMPVDILADVLLDIAIHDTGANSGLPDHKSLVYNLCNANVVEWQAMIPTILKHMPKDTKVVDFAEWVAELKKSGQDPNVNVKQNPGVKLTEFYEGVAQDTSAMEMGTALRIENAAKSSSTMQNFGRLQPEWFENWLEGWGLERTR